MVFSLDRAQTQKKQVRKLFKAKVNSKNGGSRLDWKKITSLEKTMKHTCYEI